MNTLYIVAFLFSIKSASFLHTPLYSIGHSRVEAMGNFMQHLLGGKCTRLEINLEKIIRQNKVLKSQISLGWPLKCNFLLSHHQ